MKEKIIDILEKHYNGRNHIEERCSKDILQLIIQEMEKAWLDGVNTEAVKPWETFNDFLNKRNVL